MARRRGLADAERIGPDMTTLTATGYVVTGACFVYSLDASLSNTQVSGIFSIGDSTSTGAAGLLGESTKLNFTLGPGAASAACDRLQRNFFPPLNIQNNLVFGNATGIANVSVTYLAE